MSASRVAPNAPTEVVGAKVFEEEAFDAEGIAGNKAVVIEFFDAVTNGRFDRAAELIDPDGSWLVPRRRLDRPLGVQLDLMTRETMSFRVGLLTAEADRVAALVEGDATEPDGKVYDKLYNFLFRIADGRIVRAWMYDDAALAERISQGETPEKE